MPYRFAIVGCGHIAKKHAAEIASRGELVAVCDIVPEAAAILASGTQASIYDDITTLLASEKVDILVVSSPNGLHPAHTIAGLKAGCHVLCEKPMAIHSADARAMVEVAKDTGRQLFVVKQNRFNAPVLFVKKLLDTNQLGKIHAFQVNCFWNRPARYFSESQWRGSLELDGGPLFTQFSHFIDLVCWWMGDVAEIIAARGGNFLHYGLIDFEDTGTVVLEMENGAQGTIQYSLNTFQKNMEGSITLFGEKGTVKIGGAYLNELTWFEVEGLNQPELESSPLPNQYGFYQGSMQNHSKVYDSVIRSIEGNGAAYMDPAEGVLSVQLIEEIYFKMRR
ncbi:Gfo/Idh/MocA family oxidoreductase [Flavihumibacter rivuli]|uniref:Gfo/Idh/MocA family protein n=1 Tax=Flavihumibacter rivuli TaxID=2838156 RepID=UPI001BDEFE38|nr:Gfo/Idh/MocA family oxidoreductase [Flavihumibacter rivuli]ULQ57473.1 Gfo/Idh/MocA family oxidoreductase [Flavihumibacter rivuli]